MTPIYHRILLKLSGESLAAEQSSGIDPQRVADYATQIKEIVDAGVQVAIVVGGGNIFRGLKGAAQGFDRVKGDQMGMLATVINALALSSALEGIGQPAQVFTAIGMFPIGEPYSKWRAIEAMQAGKVAICSCGTGSPFFTTDTGAVLRAALIGADAILLAKNVDGVYSADPKKDPNAVRFDTLSYAEVLERRLAVMDSTATALAMDNNIPVLVFALKDPENIRRAVRGENVGTLVK